MWAKVALALLLLLCGLAAGAPQCSGDSPLPDGWSRFQSSSGERSYLLLTNGTMSNADARMACRSFGPQFDLVVFDSQEQQAELEASAPFRELVRAGMAYYHLGIYLREQPPCPLAANQPRWVNSSWVTDPSYCWVNDTSEAAGSYSASFWRVDGHGPTAPFPFAGNETYIYTHWTSSGSLQWGYEPNSGSNCTVADRRMAYKSFLGSSRPDMHKSYMWLKGAPQQRVWGWADLGSRSCAARVHTICSAACSSAAETKSAIKAPVAAEMQDAPALQQQQQQQQPADADGSDALRPIHKNARGGRQEQQQPDPAARVAVAKRLLQQANKVQLGCGVSHLPLGWGHYQNDTDGRLYLLRSKPLSNADAVAVCRSFGPQFQLVTFDSYAHQLELESSPAFQHLVESQGMAYYHLGYHLQQLPPCPPAGSQPRWVNESWFSDHSYCYVNDTSDALGTAFRRPGGGVTAPYPFKGNATYVYSHWSMSGSHLWGAEPNSGSNCTVADKHAAFRKFLGFKRRDMANRSAWVKRGEGNVWGWADLGSRSCAAKVHTICYAACGTQEAPSTSFAVRLDSQQSVLAALKRNAQQLKGALRFKGSMSSLVADLSKQLHVSLPLREPEPAISGNLSSLADPFVQLGGGMQMQVLSALVNSTELVV